MHDSRDLWGHDDSMGWLSWAPHLLLTSWYFPVPWAILGPVATNLGLWICTLSHCLPLGHRSRLSGGGTEERATGLPHPFGTGLAPQDGLGPGT